MALKGGIVKGWYNYDGTKKNPFMKIEESYNVEQRNDTISSRTDEKSRMQF